MLGIALYHWSLVYEFEDELGLSRKCLVDAVWVLEGKVHGESDTMVFLRGVRENWDGKYAAYLEEMLEIERVIKWF